MMTRRRGLLLATAAPTSLFAIGLAATCLMPLASLPMVDGKMRAPALSALVTIDRDALGVPTISGTDRGDLAYATGFVHAQDRFFQMDLLRRSAAGEVAELLGPAAVVLDRAHRLHRFRQRALAALASASADQRRLLELYTRGINDGLNALSVRPFEYLLLRAGPTPWRAEDTILVVYSMYFELQYRELRATVARALLRDRTTDSMFALLLPKSNHWDAPLDQATTPAVNFPRVPPAKPDWLGPLGRSTTQPEGDVIAGSNSFQGSSVGG